MSEPASISIGIADRYAMAIFDLAKDDDALSTLEKDTDALDGAIKESDDFRSLTSSPLYTRDMQERAIGALAAKMDLSDLTANTLRLMARKRRLFVLPQLVRRLRERIAAEKGEVTADVASASKLTKAQADKLGEVLKSKLGSDVKLNATVDESLIGGLIVKVGSKMIDTSIRSKLDALQNMMKEAR